jgi:hypothetical protein
LILDHIEKDNTEDQNDAEQLYKFHQIIANQCALCRFNKDYKGSKYFVLVEWETEEPTYEMINLIGSDNPVTFAEYAMHLILLDTIGW